MKNKTQKHTTCEPTKQTNEKQNKKNFELSASITLHDAQPSYSLSLSAFHPWHFRVFHILSIIT
jgi:hypothetical protein